MDSFGTRLRFWRNRRHLSQRALGRHAHISGTYIGDLEEGRNTPTIPIVERLAQALEVDLAELWPGARAIVLPDDPELLDLIQRSGFDYLPEPEAEHAKRKLWESLELKRARAYDREEMRRKISGDAHVS